MSDYKGNRLAAGQRGTATIKGVDNVPGMWQERTDGVMFFVLAQPVKGVVSQHHTLVTNYRPDPYVTPNEALVETATCLAEEMGDRSAIYYAADGREALIVNRSGDRILDVYDGGFLYEATGINWSGKGRIGS